MCRTSSLTSSYTHAWLERVILSTNVNNNAQTHTGSSQQREWDTLLQNKEIIIDTPHTMAHNLRFQLQTRKTQQETVWKWEQSWSHQLKCKCIQHLHIIYKTPFSEINKYCWRVRKKVLHVKLPTYTERRPSSTILDRSNR